MVEVLPPLVSVAYLVALREQNPEVLNEFLHSYHSLRRFCPEVPVMVYHQGLSPEQLDHVRGLPATMDFPLALDRSGRFERNDYGRKHGWTFPELHVLAAKIDVLLLTPGDTLFLDADTEVRAPIDDVLRSPVPWLHESEGLLAEHDRDFSSLLDGVQWARFGWRGDPARLTMWNTGSIWVPQPFKQHLYRAKELLWALTLLPAEARGDNRLDEQIAISTALQEAVDYRIDTVAPRVHHFWREKYDGSPRWYEPRFGPAAEPSVAR